MLDRLGQPGISGFEDSATETIDIRIEPAVNAFHSLALLARADEYSGFNDWITQTNAAMSSAERERHRLSAVAPLWGGQVLSPEP